MLGNKLATTLTLNLYRVNMMIRHFFSWALILLSYILLSQNSLAAPPTLEIYSGSGSGQGPTSASGTHTFLLNRNNPSDNVGEAYTPATTVSYRITNSAYNTAVYSGQGTSANKPELMFGGTINTSSGIRNPPVTAVDILQPLNSIGAAESNMFAATLQNAPSNCSNSGGACLSTNGGIDVATNQGVSFLAMAKSLTNVNGASNARVKIGTVEITFNRPVTNPILQASGLGGTVGTGLGLSAEFTLTNSNNTAVSLQRIAGNSNFAVSGNNIINTASTLTSSSASGGGGASGSVYIKGKAITSLIFDVYMRGDGGGTYTTTSADAFFFGISSVEADSDLSIVKSQRLGTSGDFVRTQLSNIPINSVMQYQLAISNNKPQSAPVGGSAYLAPFTDVMPSSLKDISIVNTTTTGTGTSCLPTLSGNTLQGTFSGASAATCTVTIQATAATIGTITNTATIEATSTDSVTTNDTSTVNAIIVNQSVPADPPILEARFSITPNLPTIARGRMVDQFINVKNEGPNDATNAIATYMAAPTTGVTITAMNVIDGAVCILNGNNWSCPLGNVANGATRQIAVHYNTASTSTLGTAQQGIVKVSSDEFNPGSGAGETLYKVWGTNQQNETRTNGAFWAGYTGTGGTGSVNNNGSFSDENTSITGAWPINQASPTGAYLINGGTSLNDSVYTPSSTTAQAVTQKIITNMSSDPNAAVRINYITENANNEIIGDNRRAWEFTTGIYIPNTQSAKLCMGNSQMRLDDSGYILVDGAEVGRIDGYSMAVTVQGNLTLQPGYHRITYRIANRNTYNNNSERSAGGYGAIGLSLSGDCSTANYDNAVNAGIPVSINIIEGAKIKFSKISIHGTGVFEYSSLNNLADNVSGRTVDSITTFTEGTAAFTQQLWAPTLNQTVTITENAVDSYVLSSVSCTDANSSRTGNTGTFWTLVNNQLSIPAERIKEGADILCTFTNTKLIYMNISGRVFIDNSGTTLDASKAYNGIQDAGEVGIANSTIQLNNCSTTQIASTVTQANGTYSFSIEQNQLPTSFCIVQKNLPDYISVSGSNGYNRSTDTIALKKTTETNYADNNFGDVMLNVVLNEDGQHTAVAGDVTDYPHRLTTQTPVQLTQLLQTQTQQPNASTDQPWQALIYRDTNCNGQVDSGETIFNPTVSNTILLQPQRDICLVQRVHVPKNAMAGAQHIGQLQASYQLSLANPAETVSGQTLKRQDITLIGSAGLTLSKKVRAVASCPSTAADTNVFTTTNQAAKKDNLEYEVTYKNNSTKKLQNVKIKDSLPTGTSFGSISCATTPSGNTCNTNQSGSNLEWSLTGLLNPTASGTLRFCVAQ